MYIIRQESVYTEFSLPIRFFNTPIHRSMWKIFSMVDLRYLEENMYVAIWFDAENKD